MIEEEGDRGKVREMVGASDVGSSFAYSTSSSSSNEAVQEPEWAELLH
jgi:hypothetical protein